MNVRRHGAAVAAAALTACGGTAAGIVASSRPSPPPHTAVTLAKAPYGAWLRDAGDIALISTTGSVERALPSGILTRDWSRLYAVTGLYLRIMNPHTGHELKRVELPGFYQPPITAASGAQEGLSPHGRWLVLMSRPPSTEPVATDIVVLDTRGFPSPRRIHLAGDFTYDGIDDSGTNLYLTERTSGFNTFPYRYRVRRYDVRTGRLDPQVVVDKSEAAEAMTGVALSRSVSLDGYWQFTVYAFGSRGPFVHALNLATANAVCIDLPAAASSSDEVQLMWSLAQSSDGASVYAVNGGTGQVVRIATGPLPHATRSVQLHGVLTATPAAHAEGAVTTAEAKLLVTSGAALSPDGTTLYAVSGDGVISIDTTRLSMRSHLLAGETIQSIAVSADGRWLAALAHRGVLFELDTSSGKVAAVNPAAADSLAVLRLIPGEGTS